MQDAPIRAVQAALVAWLRQPSAETISENHPLKNTSSSGAAKSLHNALAELTLRQSGTSHPLSRYAAAFSGSHWLVTSLMAAGGDSIVFKLDDGHVLHITNKILTPELGSRFFDLPMIERGAVDSSGGHQVHYFVQPEAETPVSERAMRDFQRWIEGHGWMLSDRSQGQLGIFEGETKLLDPFAVERIPFWRR
jgi:hypothetical protein